MKNIFAKIFSGILTGLGIGYLSTIIISVLINKGTYFPSTVTTGEVSLNTIMIQAVLMALLGVIGTLSADIYKIEKYSLLTKSLIQFVVIIGSVLLVGVLVGWIKTLGAAVSSFIIASIIFIIIWIIMSLIMKNEISQINQKLEKRL